MTRQSVEARFHDDIEFAVSRFGDHHGLTQSKVTHWLQQIPHTRRPLAARVLRAIDYYANSNTHALARELAKATYEEYTDVKKTQILFVPIGSAGSGAQQVARHLKTVSVVPNTCVVNLLDLQRKPSKDVRVIVAFDDFSGTGQTIREWWDMNESIIRPKQADLLIGLLVLNHVARAPLEEITDRVMAIHELPPDRNVFHEDHSDLTRNQKRSLLALCRRTGCTQQYLKGRGECGLLVVFNHGCPNNSIPILWHEKKDTWEALFRRRAT